MIGVAASAACAVGSSGSQNPYRLPSVDARGDVRIRVLLDDGAEAVAVEGLGLDETIEAVPGEGLRVNGGPVVSRWRSPRLDGPLTIRIGQRKRQVRGVVEVLALYGQEAEDAKGAEGLAVVNEIALERYLAGTLGSEMYVSWDRRALQAQAVASRTYAIHQRDGRRDAPWHLTAGTRSQVYGGVDAESPEVEQALEDTRGQILVARGRPILAAFHSSSGGQTASAEEVWGQSRPYLVSVPVVDEWDSPDAYWRARVTRGTLGRAVASLGTDPGPITAARIVERTGSGRVARVQLEGERGSTTVTGRQLRTALGESKLKSTLFELREDGEDFVFVGSGSGHGVGMSQWGARAMARRGDDYLEILGTFYPGTEVTRLSGGTR